MFLDGLKYIFLFLGGGVAGVLLAEWLRRRAARVQIIPLVERVNRPVKSGLAGFVLARRLGNGALEEVENVREYQFTLRNSSPVHLHGAEIQFEFPAQDVEGQAERPTLSNTPAVLLDAVATPPWERAFRWRIPQFPATDSIEFTFRAVGPESDKYDVALYNSGPVVVEPSRRDTAGKSRLSAAAFSRELVATTALAAVVLSVWGLIHSSLGGNKELSTVNGGGCSLSVVSSYEHLNPGALPWRGPWRVEYELVDQGVQPCQVESSQLSGGTAVTVRGEFPTELTAYSTKKPTESSAAFLIGTERPTSQVSVNMYVVNNPRE